MRLRLLTLAHATPRSVRLQVVPREPVEMPPVPLEARVYQVLIPLSVIYLIIKPDLLPFPGGGGKA